MTEVSRCNTATLALLALSLVACGAPGGGSGSDDIDAGSVGFGDTSAGTGDAPGSDGGVGQDGQSAGPDAADAGRAAADTAGADGHGPPADAGDAAVVDEGPAEDVNPWPDDVDAGPPMDVPPADAEPPPDTVEPPPVIPEGALLIVEVMRSPLNAPGAGGLFVELVNTTSQSWATSALELRTSDGGVSPVVLPLVPPGERVVLAGAFDPSLNGGIAANGTFSQQLVIPQGEGDLSLWHGDVRLDVVPFGPGFPAVAGRSASLDPAVTLTDHTSNDDPSSWCPATAPYGAGDLGTPGAPNAPCVHAACGDGDKQAGEVCDDGNINPADGCETDCTPTPVCGNGVPEGPEACDDGNPVACDGCTACKVDPDVDADGVVDCEDNCVGDYNPAQVDSDQDGLGDGCDVQDCANDQIEGSETCDDGNLLSGDGCSSKCQLEDFGPSSLVITELMLRPAGAGPADVKSAWMWIELYNPGVSPVDVAGMTFGDDFLQSATLDPAKPVLVPPGAFAVLAKDVDGDGAHGVRR